MESWEGSQLNEAKELLAFEVTKLVHGEEEALKAKEAARALFGAGVDSENMPTTALSDADFTEGAVTVADLLVKTGLANSKGAGRRLIEQGGISIGSEKVSDPFESVDRDDFAENGYIVLKKGKKVYHKVTL